MQNKDYLAMGVYLLSYFEDRLYDDSTPQNYYKKLIQISTIEYLKDFKKALDEAVTKDDFMLSEIESPLMDKFKVEDIKFFFKKLQKELDKYIPKETT